MSVTRVQLHTGSHRAVSVARALGQSPGPDLTAAPAQPLQTSPRTDEHLLRKPPRLVRSVILVDNNPEPGTSSWYRAGLRLSLPRPERPVDGAAGHTGGPSSLPTTGRDVRAARTTGNGRRRLCPNKSLFTPSGCLLRLLAPERRDGLEVLANPWEME